MEQPIPNKNEKFLSEDDFIVSKTDTKGVIAYGNKSFIQLSGYSDKELLGSPHSILRHPDMPQIVFKMLWNRILKKEEIFAYVKNLSKDGSYYWVFANVTATTDAQGQIRDFHSVRRKPSAKSMEVIPSLYRELLSIEKSQGLEASKKFLDEQLNKQGMTYDEFVLSLQH
ncbi:PAS domain-containing protein [Sulfurospirillum oryzae]|uniref:PAS domain-containing protein n=1 Tax=Sulfurospirillum oryzae TaxID=2976535 RepID=UPI0021E860BB|nr:PAS domain-containing protein [Sulfurospirillum oryzae]